ncbi:hypothetical protein CY35_12G042800 [Sphagnum magellanicum]|nr:hypothetical protein CY35_12G042800 [Sphagnum magellanicum]
MAAALCFSSVSPLSSSNGLVLGQGIVCEKQSANTTRMRSQNIVIRCSKAEGPLRRPSAPVAAPSVITSAPPPATSPPPPAPQSPASSASVPAAAAALVSSSKSSSLSIEYQRQRAKEMQDYFLDKKFEDQIRAGRLFGWTQKNEIGNGGQCLELQLGCLQNMQRAPALSSSSKSSFPTWALRILTDICIRVLTLLSTSTIMISNLGIWQSQPTFVKQGSNFVEQLKIIISIPVIADLN